MELVTLHAKKRTLTGTSHSRRMRADGEIPAVLYGRRQEVQHIQIDRDDFLNRIRTRSRVFAIDIEGGEAEAAMLQEVQWDHLGERVYHVDFNRISLDEKLEIEIAISLVGLPKGVVIGAGDLVQSIRRVRIKCLPTDIPDTLEVKIGSLNVGDVIRVKDLPFAASAEVIGVNIEDPVAAVVEKAAEVEPTEEGEEGAEGEGAEGAEGAEGGDDSGGES